jgi:AGZA family xanthine/uracil permease-like MFS transporter
MFFAPLATAIPAYATAPALILVGVLMAQSIAHIRWQEVSEALPAFITILVTLLTFSIATGLSFEISRERRCQGCVLNFVDFT